MYKTRQNAALQPFPKECRAQGQSSRPTGHVVTPPQFVMGLVTHLHKNEYGFVSGEIYFNQSVVEHSGRGIKIGDQVVVEVEPILSTAKLPFKQTAKSVKLITKNMVPNNDQQQRYTPTHYKEACSSQLYGNGLRSATAADDEEYSSRSNSSDSDVDQESFGTSSTWKIGKKSIAAEGEDTEEGRREFNRQKRIRQKINRKLEAEGRALLGLKKIHRRKNKGVKKKERGQNFKLSNIKK